MGILWFLHLRFAPFNFSSMLSFKLTVGVVTNGGNGVWHKPSRISGIGDNTNTQLKLDYVIDKSYCYIRGISAAHK